MKKGLRITAYVFLAIFVILSISIQLLSLQDNESSGKVSGSLSKKIISLIYGNENTTTDTTKISIESLSISQSYPGSEKEAQSYLDIITEVLPANATEDVLFVTTNPQVATVDKKGRITFLTPGSVTIYATNESGDIRSNQLTFTVIDKKSSIDSLDLSLLEIVKVDLSPIDSLDINQLISITYLYGGKTFPIKNAYFEVSDESVLTIFRMASTHIVAKKQGVANINLMFDGEIIATKQVTVTDKVLEKPIISNFSVGGFSEKEITIELGEIYDVNVQIENLDTCTNALYYKLKNSDGKSIISITYSENATKYLFKALTLGSESILVVPFCDTGTPVYEFKLNVIPPRPVIWGLDGPKEFFVDKKYSLKLKASSPDMLLGYNLSCSSPFSTISDDGKIKFTRTGKYDIVFSSEYYPDEIYTFTVIVKNENYALTVRKGLGHAGLFTLLAISATVAFGILIKSKLKSTAFISFIGLFNAILSEVLQLPVFSSGRSARLRDILIDYSGYLIGFVIASAVILIVYFTVKRIKNKKKPK